MEIAEYPETADIETSTDKYALRFSGTTGKWMMEVQETITLSLISDIKPCRALDVGGGHGQITLPLCRKGYTMTVLSSAESCRNRIQTAIDSGQCTFQVGNVIDLPFPDGSFPLVVSFRLMTHCNNWQKFVSELCRVSSRSIVFDYPTSQSINAVAPALFKVKKRLEQDTRHWHLFKHRELTEEFEKNGFRRAATRAQFFWPMALHRAIKSVRFSTFLESSARAVGLTKILGSPVITRMEKK